MEEAHRINKEIEKINESAERKLFNN